MTTDLQLKNKKTIITGANGGMAITRDRRPDLWEKYKKI